MKLSRDQRGKALRALTFAELARLDEQELKERFSEVVFLNDTETDTQGFLLQREGELVIAFRGTRQTKDWATNFNAWHVTFPYDNFDSKILVHRGFIKAYKSVRDKIHAYIKDRTVKPTVCGVCGKYVNSNRMIERFTIAGHSLGGALATLCAVDMQYNFGWIPVECYPSGNPKVGNKHFVKSYNKRVPNTIRTYMRTDLVPHLPPRWFGKYTKGGYKATAKANPIGPRNIFIGLKLWFQRNFVTKNFAAELTNHSIAVYRKYI